MVGLPGDLASAARGCEWIEKEVRAHPAGHRSCGEWPSVNTIKVNDTLKAEVTKGLV